MCRSSASLLVFPLLLLLLPLSSQSTPSLSASDREVLLDIRGSLFDLPGSSFFASWNFSEDPCARFSGLRCSPDWLDPTVLRIHALALGTGLTDSPGLGGTLPPSLLGLASLKELVVFPGRVSGPIPPGLGPPSLRLVSISSNRLVGPIPACELPLLHTLDLSQNQLEGAIPPSLLSSSPSLKFLLLAFNGGLSGPIPFEISSSPALLHLDLRGNSFSGPLPSLPPSLRFFSAAFNSLSGPLPTSPSPALEFLDLSSNTFAGPIPPSVLALPLLSTLILARNNLSGFVPIPPSPSPRWATVDLSHNALSGRPPPGLAAAATLRLNDNCFAGPFPREYVDSVRSGSMTALYAQRNFLTAALPGTLFPPAATLCLSYNCMVPPPAAIAGCPEGSDGRISRPASQCPAADGEGVSN